MLLNAVGGCGAWPFELACAVFVLEEVVEAGWLVEAPTAGEARELGFALETVAATLGPPTAVPLVDVNGMVDSIAISKTVEHFVGKSRRSKSKLDCGAVMWQSFTQRWGVGYR